MSKKNDNNTPQLFEVEEFISYHRKESKTYEAFCDKFKVKENVNKSDECYTPPTIFEYVYSYVRELFPQYNSYENLRPFKPNDNFIAENYTNKIVIDNPPFSFLTKIVKWYQTQNIKFWLFAPTLTIMQLYGLCDIVITSNNIIFLNGANVNISFVTNMFGDKRIVLDGILKEKISPKKKRLNQYPFILSGARLGKFIKENEIQTISIKDTLPIISSKYKIFGNGCYFRKNTLSSINNEKSTLTDAEKLYLKEHDFIPIC